MRVVSFRVLGVLATALAVAGIGAQMVPAAASSHGTLYGLTPDVNVVDPASGALTPLASLAGVGPNLTAIAFAADQGASTLVALTSTTCCPGGKGFPGGPFSYQLASINASTGAVSVSPALQLPIADSIAVDPVSHDVWGVVNCSDPTITCTTQPVVSIDPSTGVETDVATLPVTANFDTLVALAPGSNTLYIALDAGGVKQLLAMDTVTHAVATLGTLNSVVTGLAVDPADGALYAILGNSAPLGFTQTLNRVDPTTGSTTVVATCSCNSFNSPAIAPKSHTLFAVANVLVQNSSQYEIATVDLRNGRMTFGGPINTLTMGPIAFLARSHA